MKKVIEKCKKAEVYMYLIPSMVIFSIFLFYPFFKTIYLSLYKTNKLGEAKLYVGLDNYKSLLSNPSFYNSLWVTLEFVAIVVVGSMALVLLGAVLCSKAFPGIRVFSTSYALPMAVASSSGAMIFKIILNPTIINRIINVSKSRRKIQEIDATVQPCREDSHTDQRIFRITDPVNAHMQQFVYDTDRGI